MNQKEYLEIKQTMKIKGLPFEWQRLNVIRHHNRHESGETWKHFLCKAITGKILYDANRNYFSEYEFPDGSVADIFDVTNWAVVEFENDCTDRKENLKLVRFRKHLNTRQIREIFVFRLNELPDDPVGIESCIRKRLGL